MKNSLRGINVNTYEYREDGNIKKNINNNFIANNNDEVDPNLDKGYILSSCSTLASHSNTYQQTVATSTTDAQKRSLSNAPKTVIPTRANSGIVLITTKPNQSDESKLIHYNSSTGKSNNALSKTNLELFNSVQKATENNLFSSSQKQTDVGPSDQQQQSKTATILVSKSKTKTGLPLLLKKSK